MIFSVGSVYRLFQWQTGLHPIREAFFYGSTVDSRPLPTMKNLRPRNVPYDKMLSQSYTCLRLQTGEGEAFPVDGARAPLRAMHSIQTHLPLTSSPCGISWVKPRALFFPEPGQPAKRFALALLGHLPDLPVGEQYKVSVWPSTAGQLNPECPACQTRKPIGSRFSPEPRQQEQIVMPLHRMHREHHIGQTPFGSITRSL
jgi:hypothetical protein